MELLWWFKQRSDMNKYSFQKKKNKKKKKKKKNKKKKKTKKKPHLTKEKDTQECGQRGERKTIIQMRSDKTLKLKSCKESSLGYACLSITKINK